MELECQRHGLVRHTLRADNGRWRCTRCVSEAVTRNRKVKRATLVAEAGGQCQLCGYDRYIGALEFHHLDPSQKVFAMSQGGQTVSLERLRAEAAKCVLLCANCHAEVEGGYASVA